MRENEKGVKKIKEKHLNIFKGANVDILKKVVFTLKNSNQLLP